MTSKPSEVHLSVLLVMVCWPGEGVLYCNVLYCTVLYCTVLYCTCLFSSSWCVGQEKVSTPAGGGWCSVSPSSLPDSCSLLSPRTCGRLHQSQLSIVTTNQSQLSITTISQSQLSIYLLVTGDRVKGLLAGLIPPAKGDNVNKLWTHFVIHVTH